MGKKMWKRYMQMEIRIRLMNSFWWANIAVMFSGDDVIVFYGTNFSAMNCIQIRPTINGFGFGSSIGKVSWKPMKGKD